MTMPEAYGGQDADRLFPIVLVEELAKRNLSGPFFHLHSDVVAPYLLAYGDEPMKAAWLPRMARGEAIGAIAMTARRGGSNEGARPPPTGSSRPAVKMEGAKAASLGKVDHGAGPSGESPISNCPTSIPLS